MSIDEYARDAWRKEIEALTAAFQAAIARAVAAERERWECLLRAVDYALRGPFGAPHAGSVLLLAADNLGDSTEFQDDLRRIERRLRSALHEVTKTGMPEETQ